MCKILTGFWWEIRAWKISVNELWKQIEIDGGFSPILGHHNNRGKSFQDDNDAKGLVNTVFENNQKCLNVLTML